MSQISKLGIGTSNIASLGRSITFKKAQLIFKTALDYNINTIDTSDTYGSGDAETLIGKIIREDRKKYFIISKAGMPTVNLPSFLSPINQITKKIKVYSGFKKRFDKRYIISNLEKSLKRLKIEYLDVFLLHNLDMNDIDKYKTECFEALHIIKKKGLSRFVGVSSHDNNSLNYIIKNVDLDYVQTNMIFNENQKIEKLKNNFKVIVNSLLSQKIETNLEKRINDLISKYKISINHLNIILLMHCIFKRKINCSLFSTKNLNHLKIIGETYIHFKNNSLSIFDELEEILIDKKY